MYENDGVHIDCHTCVAANTTACNDCLVTHLLANDAGPIELVLAPRSARRAAVETMNTTMGTTVNTTVEVAVERFARAGLLDDPPVFVDPAAFAAGTLGEPATLVATGTPVR